MGINAGVGIAAVSAKPAGDLANAVVTGVFAGVGPGQPFPFVGWFNLSVWASFVSALTTTGGSSSATVASAGTIAAGDGINSTLVPPGTTVGAISGTTVTLAFPTLTLAGVVKSNGVISNLKTTSGLLGTAVSGPGIPSGATVSQIVTPALQNPSFQNAQNQEGTILLSNTATVLPATREPRAEISFALTNSAVTAGTDNNATFAGLGVVFNGSVQLEKSFDGGLTYILASLNNSGSMAQWNGSNPISGSFWEPERGVLYRMNCTAYTGNGNALNYRLSESGAGAQSMTFT